MEINCSVAHCKNDGKHQFQTKLGFELVVCDYHKKKKEQRDDSKTIPKGNDFFPEL